MSNHLKTISTSGNDLVVGNYMVLFGGRDLVGEYFTKNTRFDSNFTDLGLLYVDFEHGRDVDSTGNEESNVLGVVDWKSARADDKGFFVHRVLNRRAQYVEFLSELIEAGIVGNSSESVRGKAVRTKEGEITAWPLKRDTLTVTPMEPRMVTSNVLAAAKSLAEAFPHSKSLGSLIGLPTPDEDELKSIEGIACLRDAEKYLCKAGGMSKAQAVAFVGRLKSIRPGDPVDASGGPGDPVASVDPVRLARALSILTKKVSP